MRSVVWKFRIPFPMDEFTLTMRGVPKVLHVGMQDDAPHLWARLNPDVPESTHRFRVAGTGHDLNENVGRHLGTWFDGPNVWHLFDVEPFGHDGRPFRPGKRVRITLEALP